MIPIQTNLDFGEKEKCKKINPYYLKYVIMFPIHQSLYYYVYF